MGKLIVLNQQNLIQDGTNSRFVYTFPNGGYVMKNDLIAVLSISQYFSTFNISASLGNNKASYDWVNTIEYFITFPDGYYSISDINAYVQSVMYANGHYLTLNSAPTLPLYFINWSANTTRYAYQLDLKIMNTTIYPLGTYTNGVSTNGTAVWTRPTSTAANCPQFVIFANFNLLVGFAVGTYPTSQFQISSQSFLSSVAPQILPQPVIFVYCSLVNNRAVIPNSLIYAYTPQGVAFGAIQTYEPTSELAWCRVLDGNYNQFVIELRDGAGQPITFQDPNTTFILYSKNINEYGEVNI